MRYPLARAAQAAANAAYGGDAFPRPDDNLIRQVMATVPDVVGKSVEEATSILTAAGFQVTVGGAIDSTLAAGLVAAQDPSGQAAGGATINLATSNGQGTAVPANLVGMSRSDAAAALGGAGFTSIEFDNSCNPPTATVASTNPAPGAAASKSTTVTVTCQ
jgi:beta-lactam-binding protein with PASTA domain